MTKRPSSGRLFGRTNSRGPSTWLVSARRHFSDSSSFGPGLWQNRNRRFWRSWTRPRGCCARPSLCGKCSWSGGSSCRPRCPRWIWSDRWWDRFGWGLPIWPRLLRRRWRSLVGWLGIGKCVDLVLIGLGWHLSGWFSFWCWRGKMKESLDDIIHDLNVSFGFVFNVSNFLVILIWEVVKNFWIYKKKI